MALLSNIVNYLRSTLQRHLRTTTKETVTDSAIEKQYIIYLDIIGFKEYLQDVSSNPSKEQSLISFFEYIKESYFHNAEVEEINEQTYSTTFAGTILSDAIVIGYPYSLHKTRNVQTNKRIPEKFRYEEPHTLQSIFNTFYSFIADISSKALLDLGLMVRGCIHYADTYIKPPIIFGPGIIEAYRFEQDHVRMPAVFIHPKILEREQDKNFIENDNKGFFNRYEELYFLDQEHLITGQNGEAVKKIIESGLEASTVHHHKAKWQWLLDSTEGKFRRK